MDQTKTCKHCGKPIHKVMSALGEKWMHYVPGASSRDDYWFCHITTAEPGGRKRKPPLPMPPKVRIVQGFGI